LAWLEADSNLFRGGNLNKFTGTAVLLLPVMYRHFQLRGYRVLFSFDEGLLPGGEKYMYFSSTQDRFFEDLHHLFIYKAIQLVVPESIE
jgi:hypothetical protein